MLFGGAAAAAALAEEGDATVRKVLFGLLFISVIPEEAVAMILLLFIPVIAVLVVTDGGKITCFPGEAEIQRNILHVLISCAFRVQLIHTNVRWHHSTVTASERIHCSLFRLPRRALLLILCLALTVPRRRHHRRRTDRARWQFGWHQGAWIVGLRSWSFAFRIRHGDSWLRTVLTGRRREILMLSCVLRSPTQTTLTSAKIHDRLK